MSTKKVFISYSHDSDEHLERVLGLAERLRDDGIESLLDQYVKGSPVQGWPRWMLDQLDAADSVLVICTETYYRRFRGHEVPDKGKGADWEGAFITQETYDKRSTTLKFLPVLFDLEDEPFIPEPLRKLSHYLLNSEANYGELCDFLIGAAGVEPRPVGPPKTKQRRRGVALTFDQNSSSESQPRISPTRLSVTGKKFLGREEELQLLDNAWDSTGEQKINIVSLIGQGGEGKSAIALEWYSRRARSGWQGARRVFDWSFYSQGTSAQSSASADDFFNAAFQWFGYTGEVPKDPRDKGAKLAELVSAERTLLVLDGLEPLQQPPGDYGGEFKDPAMKALLRGLAMHNPGLCVLTSRVDIADLASFERADGSCVRRLLYALDLDTARLLLRELGVRGPERELDEAIAWFHGHAYDLNLLGNYLAQCTPDHDIRGWQERFPILREDERIHPVADAAGKRAGHGRRMLRAYVRWLGAESAAVAILRLLGLFDRPARSDLLDELRAQPIISGLTGALVPLPDDEWLRTLGQLEQLALITREPLSLPADRTAVEQETTVSADDIPDERVQMLLQRDDLPAELKSLSLAELKQLIAQVQRRGENKGTPAKRARRHVSFTIDAHPLLREHFAAELRDEHPDTWRAAHRRLYEYLCDTTPDKPQPTLEDLQPLYQAVAHGCRAGLQQEAAKDAYFARILRRNENYSAFKLGAVGSDLGAVACFFEKPWSRTSLSLSEAYQAWMFNNAAYFLRALGRLTESLEPLRAGLPIELKREDWTNAAIRTSNLSELELTLGEVAGAVRDAEQSVTYADRSGDAFQRMVNRTTHADALHQAGHRAEAETRLSEAEQMQAERQPDYPLLSSIGSFRYCDLLLSGPERTAWQQVLGIRASVLQRADSLALSEDVAGSGEPTASEAEIGGSPPHSKSLRDVQERGKKMFEWRVPGDPLLDIGLDHLMLGRAALYGAIFEFGSHQSEEVEGTSIAPDVGLVTSAATELDDAVEGLRRAGQAQELPRGLLTRAWLRFLTGARTGSESAQEDLDEAWEIAERGPMRLFMADIHLYRVRLFHGLKPYPWGADANGNVRAPKDDLAAARKLIQQCGYWRRKEELEDAEEAAKNW